MVNVESFPFLIWRTRDMYPITGGVVLPKYVRNCGYRLHLIPEHILRPISVWLRDGADAGGMKFRQLRSERKKMRIFLLNVSNKTV